MKKGIHRASIGISLIMAFCMIYGACWASESEKININTATVEQLTSLDKIGPRYAQRIIDFRNENGPFQSSEDLMKVKGIGMKTWEAIKDRVVVK